MTVSSQVKQTLASLKGARATLEILSTIEKNTEVKDVYKRSTQRVERVISNFEDRLKVLEFEEPQYKGF
ncbi:DUF1657 domain-containing protein [Desulfolucanica intricata]|uniref:DUF1657 domain-containing protein n=1 Tax=Desulfolucanica intricata TaxID=1285191 RepID=UPI0008344769|nr:DUF1657 domain-containing protein [Desulfolucanica intricata]